MNTSAVAVLVSSLSLAAGCTDAYIPNTEILDTRDNRDVIEFCEQYRRAVEAGDPAALLRMASPRYLDDGGTASPEDDVDLAGLKTMLETSLPAATPLRYDMRYRSITAERDRIRVDYSYTAIYRLPGRDTDKHTTADNRLELERGDGSFKILAGM